MVEYITLDMGIGIIIPGTIPCIPGIIPGTIPCIPGMDPGTMLVIMVCPTPPAPGPLWYMGGCAAPKRPSFDWKDPGPAMGGAAPLFPAPVVSVYEAVRLEYVRHFGWLCSMFMTSIAPYIKVYMSN